MNTKKKSARTYMLKRDYEALGVYLAEKRQAAGLTQREVADALGYSSAQFISNFERGIATPPLPKLKLLLGMYRMPVEAVVDLILSCERERIGGALKRGATKTRA